ncbi:YqaJ viral recombinase family protein [Altererythrobacter sp. SALINAS58]|uniref:YqaJ viral recombinase family protein n=1 Tax=Alteripontixanthobacter muriae TaxID=2705546 RepID=UPI0015762724|nr:YqaJ viral recombinase family protein [Alteripontixanthobacter muriae]NTZ42129.1 YqaJ viral recombinase family protein [Alteripontixanthobacter muriae]
MKSSDHFAGPPTKVTARYPAVSSEPAVAYLPRPMKEPSAQTAWPSLDALQLGEAAQLARRATIGGSDANIILSGSPERVLRLWREKRGEEGAEDLSDKLPVMLGCWTEVFNRQWYTRITGQKVDRIGERISCKTHAWRSCTLDGFVDEKGAGSEAKHTSAFAKPEEVLARYMPQLQHNMAVVGCERALLSVIFGNAKFEIFEVASDWLYQEDLVKAEAKFWASLQSGDPPAALPAPLPPQPVGVREVCLESSNAWAASAADWLAHREAARKHQLAATLIKELVEPDVARAFGHGIEAKRSKAGAITIREAAQ